MTRQITLIATLHARAGKEAALLERMQAMAHASRQEPGCVRYDLQRAVDDPGHLIVVEYWRDAAALDLHDASAHMAALAADLPGLIDRPVATRKFTPAG